MSEALKMLSPSSLDPRKAGRATGDKLTPSDVSHALGKIRNPNASLFAHVTGTLDSRAFDKLETALLWEVVGLAEKGNWHIERAGILRSLVRLAIIEAVSGALCWSCGGEGGQLIDKRWQVCPDCQGRRYRNPTDEWRARQISVPVRQWRSKWKARYRQVAALVDGWDREVRAALKLLS